MMAAKPSVGTVTVVKPMIAVKPVTAHGIGSVTSKAATKVK